MGAIADAIVEYVQPLIDSTDGSLEKMNKAMAIGQACFNLALMPEDSRQSILDEMRSSMQMNDEEFADFERNVLAPMIRRHQAMFPGMHQRAPLGSPHWELSSSRNSSSRNSSFRSRALPPVPTIRPTKEKSSQPGRYDPCPCNSGKKYKFCCGSSRG